MNTMLLALTLASLEPNIALVTALDRAPLPPAAADLFGLTVPEGFALDEVALEIADQRPVVVEVQARVGWTATVAGRRIAVRPVDDAVTRWRPWTHARLPPGDLALFDDDPSIQLALTGSIPRVEGASSVQLELRELRVRVREPRGKTRWARAVYTSAVDEEPRY
jgi:hypothetical protein